MNRLHLFALSLFVVSISVLSVKPAMAQSQTPGQITQFDPNLNVVDSVITQDSNANIGIGTTKPAAKLDVVGGSLNLENSSATSGNILKSGVPFLHNYGTFNTFLGFDAGNFTMTGVRNTASGNEALFSNTTGRFNTASGSGALFNNTTGSSNTASGDSALFSNTTGNENTASGQLALFNNTTGSDNTVSGFVALLHNTTGSFNTASGTSALFNNTEGGFNTASGGALFFNTTGSNNTAYGYVALRNNTTGSANTAVGVGADVSQGNLSNATAIGYLALVDASNKIRLGNSEVTVVEGPPYQTVSDKNAKENFKTINAQEVLGKIRGMNVASWNYIGQDPKQFRHYGPVAQDFFAAFGDDGVGTIGSPTTITSTDMNGVLMLAVQALGQENDAFKAENAELKARIEALERRTKNRSQRVHRGTKTTYEAGFSSGHIVR